jgi:methylmalonyl-CoA mutase N-terminal domain/subunit
LDQTEKLKQLRNERDAELVAASFVSLESAAKEGRNVMPIIIEAVERKLTLGEIADVFRNVFGEYRA